MDHVKRLLAALTVTAAAASPVAAGHAPGHYGACSHAEKCMAGYHGQHHRAGSHGPARLGVAMAPLSQQALDELGLEYGVRIARVMPGSAAAEAGLRAGDIVTDFADRPAYSPERLRHLVMSAGDAAAVALRRGDATLRLLAELPTPGPTAGAGKAALGVRIQPMTPDLQEAFGADSGRGVLISEVTADSAAGRLQSQIRTVRDAKRAESIEAEKAMLAKGLVMGLDGEEYEAYKKSVIETTQEQLSGLGLYDGPVDGWLEKTTKRALAALQAQHGLGGSGVPTPKTRKVLRGEDPHAEEDS